MEWLNYQRFTLLKYGLAAVLVFVGLRMVWLNHTFGGKFPIEWSHGIIGGIIALSIAGSRLATREERRGAGEKRPSSAFRD